MEVIELDAVELHDRYPLQHPPMQRWIGLDVPLLARMADLLEHGAGLVAQVTSVAAV